MLRGLAFGRMAVGDATFQLSQYSAWFHNEKDQRDESKELSQSTLDQSQT
jgi:hypothetical protein